MRLDVRRIDHLRVARSAAIRRRTEQILPYAASSPPHKAIVDRRWRAVFRRAIAPPAAALQYMQNATDHAAIIHASLAAHIGRQKRRELLPLFVAQPKQIASHDPLILIPPENHYPIHSSRLLLGLDPSCGRVAAARGCAANRAPSPLRACRLCVFPWRGRVRSWRGHDR